MRETGTGSFLRSSQWPIHTSVSFLSFIFYFLVAVRKCLTKINLKEKCIILMRNLRHNVHHDIWTTVGGFQGANSLVVLWIDPCSRVHVYLGTPGGQTRVFDSLQLELQVLVRCLMHMCRLNPGPWQEQYELLTAEKSL